ncbi:hypothetical protein Afil01_22070 [Actinorhabdospora filicis]|uniref:Uncharacterized protein n=1 Tax=Actinorhabdospora filicis TaxID=1785913 RepID=A0A9W6SK46_9ACTN|nr:hypothetical protein [Actinorhabdospora filicis]GLZ77400.1 hypothetical protein Afil01_22070 [Actinorhabdospora filicis]
MSEAKKLPKPVYAAAGAGELALEQLRKLPGRLGELRENARLEERLGKARENLRDVGGKVRGLDKDGLREAAMTAVGVAAATAAKAQVKARETYADLIERGERVAAGERSPIKVRATIAKPEGAEAPSAAETPEAKVAEEPKTTPRKRAPRAKKTDGE